MPDFSKGKIYVVRNIVGAPEYIGSTTQRLNSRWSHYRNHHDKPDYVDYNFKICGLMRQHRFDKFQIELLEDYPCASPMELLAREGYWQKEYIAKGRPICNTRIEGTTDLKGQGETSQYFRDNPESYKRAKERMAERIKCDICGKEGRRGDISRHQKTDRCKAAAARANRPKITIRLKPRTKIEIKLRRKECPR